MRERVGLKPKATTPSPVPVLNRPSRPWGVIQAKPKVGAPDDQYEREADRIADDVTATGQLPSALRGHDFSRIRIHADEHAAEAAATLNARAFTFGSDIYFGASEYAPETRPGQRLLVHELAHAVQQTTSSPRVQRARHLLYADGYPRPAHFRSDQREIQCLQGVPAGCVWSPWNDDFAALAGGSGGGTPCGSFDALLAFIEAQPDWSIEELGLVGHANEDGLAFAGTILPDNVDMLVASMVGPVETLEPNAARIERIRNRFARNARIYMFGCHTGSTMTLLNQVSAGFRVCVRGFTHPIRYRVQWNGNTVTSRGEVGAGEAEEELHAIGLAAPAMYSSNVWSLQPDEESCYGAPVEVMTRVVSGAAEKTLSPDAVVRRILDSYFDAEKAKVQRVEWDPAIRLPRWLEGGSMIVLRPHGTGPDTTGVISVGDEFAAATTQDTFEDRIDQVEWWALRLIDEWIAGTADPRETWHITSR